MAETSIEWTERSWNPIVGCTVVSPGCTNCYAMGIADRFKDVYRGRKWAGAPAEAMTRRVNGKAVWTGHLTLAPDHVLLQPLRRRKPTTYFVNSMGDLFHEHTPEEWIDLVVAIMALCPQHTFQILTKRGDRMRKHMSPTTSIPMLGRLPLERIHLAAAGDIEGENALFKDLHRYGSLYSLYCSVPWPLPNVWLGVSAEDQKRADERIPELLATPAAVRFVSAEPLLGPIDMKRWAPTGRWGKRPGGERAWFPSYYMTRCEHCGWIGSSELCGYDSGGDDSDVYCARCHRSIASDELPRLDWIIVGGESGPSARPMHPNWPRQIRDQCAAAGTAFFFKQWGEWLPDDVPSEIAEDLELRNRHAAIDDQQFARAGKKAAGRLLDGIEHSAMPEAAR